jgi:hypothetical protein
MFNNTLSQIGLPVIEIVCRYDEDMIVVSVKVNTKIRIDEIDSIPYVCFSCSLTHE